MERQRAVLSYDDISPAAPALVRPGRSADKEVTEGHADSSEPPKKRGRWSKPKAPKFDRHWDDPGSDQAAPIDNGGNGEEGSGSRDYGPWNVARANVEQPKKTQNKKGKKKKGGKGNNKTLSQAEVWDDSALVDAWESAAAEYEALNGPGKAWKNEPIVKSAIWYGETSSTNAAADDEGQEEDLDETANGEASNFEEEDDEAIYGDLIASLREGDDEADGEEGDTSMGDVGAMHPILSAPKGGKVSKDEAFQRALNASYWMGYWTGLYHNTNQDGMVVQEE